MASDRMVEQPRISSDGLQIAQKLLGLYDRVDPPDLDTTNNTIFVAVDFEHLDNFHRDMSMDLNTQTGLAILDPKNIMTSTPNKAISTSNFASGTTKYRAKARRDFLFGNPSDIALENILSHVQSCIPSSRKIILIGHNISYDLRVLRAIGFDFQPVVAILDTLWIVNKLRGKQVSLRRALVAEGCPFDRLHCAGNDANFTLRLLLLLVVRNYSGSSRAKYRGKLEEIACDPVPLRDYPHIKAAKKKLKRLQRTRKYQSRFWDAEKQDEIRAERAARRQAQQSKAMPVTCVELAIALSGIDLTDADEQKRERVDVEQAARKREWRELLHDVVSTGMALFDDMVQSLCRPLRGA